MNPISRSLLRKYTVFSAKRWIRERPATKKPQNTEKAEGFWERKRDSVIWHSTSFSTGFHAIGQLKFTNPQISLLQILGKSTTWAINFILRIKKRLELEPPRSVDQKLLKEKYLIPADFTRHFTFPPCDIIDAHALCTQKDVSDVYFLFPECFLSHFSSTSPDVYARKIPISWLKKTPALQVTPACGESAMIVCAAGWGGER